MLMLVDVNVNVDIYIGLVDVHEFYLFYMFLVCPGGLCSTSFGPL